MQAETLGAHLREHGLIDLHAAVEAVGVCIVLVVCCSMLRQLRAQGAVAHLIVAVLAVAHHIHNHIRLPGLQPVVVAEPLVYNEPYSCGSGVGSVVQAGTLS